MGLLWEKALWVLLGGEGKFCTFGKGKRDSVIN